MSRRDHGRGSSAPVTPRSESPLRAIRRTVSRVAAVATLAFVPVSAIETVVSIADGSGGRGLGFAALTAMSLIVGAGMLRVDWGAPPSWVRPATIASMLVMLALANGLRPQPYQAGVHFVTVSVWIGATLRPRQAAALAPLYAAAFWLPLRLAGAADGYSSALP
jgi:hypothetical protein